MSSLYIYWFDLKDTTFLLLYMLSYWFDLNGTSFLLLYMLSYLTLLEYFDKERLSMTM